MKNKEDDSNAKSDEFLAFESLTKLLVTTKKKKNREKFVRSSVSTKPKQRKQLSKKS